MHPVLIFTKIVDAAAFQLIALFGTSNCWEILDSPRMAEVAPLHMGERRQVISPVCAEVLPGSVLEALLFLVFINDITEVIKAIHYLFPMMQQLQVILGKVKCQWLSTHYEPGCRDCGCC